MQFSYGVPMSCPLNSGLHHVGGPRRAGATGGGGRIRCRLRDRASGPEPAVARGRGPRRAGPLRGPGRHVVRHHPAAPADQPDGHSVPEPISPGQGFGHPRCALGRPADPRGRGGVHEVGVRRARGRLRDPQCPLRRVPGGPQAGLAGRDGQFRRRVRLRPRGHPLPPDHPAPRPADLARGEQQADPPAGGRTRRRVDADALGPRGRRRAAGDPRRPHRAPGLPARPGGLDRTDRSRSTSCACCPDRPRTPPTPTPSPR